MRPDMDQYLRGVVLSVNLPNVDCIDRAILTAIITHFLVMVCSILRNHPLFTPIQSANTPVKVKNIQSPNLA